MNGTLICLLTLSEEWHANEKWKTRKKWGTNCPAARRDHGDRIMNTYVCCKSLPVAIIIIADNIASTKYEPPRHTTNGSKKPERDGTVDNEKERLRQHCRAIHCTLWLLIGPISPTVILISRGISWRHDVGIFSSVQTNLLRKHNNICCAYWMQTQGIMALRSAVKPVASFEKLAKKRRKK